MPALGSAAAAAFEDEPWIGKPSRAEEPAPAPVPAPAEPPPWPEQEPASFAECEQRLEAARLRIDRLGYQPKYSDAQLAAQAAQASGPVQDRFLVNFRCGGYKPDETLGTNSTNGQVRYWSTTFDQIEDADTDPALIAAKLGIPASSLDPSKGYSLAIIDSQSPDLAGGHTIVPTYENLGALVKTEAGDELDSELVDSVLSPAYEETYQQLDAGYAGFCKGQGIQPWDRTGPQRYAQHSGLKGNERDRYVTRRTINNKFGANSEFTGNGTTKHLGASSKRRGCVETLTLQRNPPIVSSSSGIKILKIG